MSNQEKIDDLLNKIRNDNSFHSTPSRIGNSTFGTNPSRPNLPLSLTCSPDMRRPNAHARPNALRFMDREHNVETENKLKEIMKISGKLTINNIIYNTNIKQMEDLEELGHGTCGHVYKMRHQPSKQIIAVKQMRRSGNTEESKRIIMDIEVVLKSHDSQYIVHCLGCFITESEVWICMELMATCFDKLLKRLRKPIPERILGKVTVATVEALSYLKDKHGVMHRDVKPSNILLDEKGNVKLCDFGISGRLVDSMAKTRSAGCAAYMAPERIEPNPDNPDYDVRADVWSLGITLVELATGVFPYQDCKTDFEVLAKVINQDPPRLPANQDFSNEFRSFVECCLRKEHQLRPKYLELKKHMFIKKYETEEVNVGEWFVKAVEEADKAAERPHAATSALRRLFTSHQRQPSLDSHLNAVQYTTNNGSQKTTGSPYLPLKIADDRIKPPDIVPPHSFPPLPSAAAPVDTRSVHNSRLSTFQSASLSHQRENSPAFVNQRNANEYQCTTEGGGSYSPYRAVGNNVPAAKFQESHIPISQRKVSSVQENINKFNSPILQRRLLDNSSPYPQKRGLGGENYRWKSPLSSPLPLRSQCQTDGEQSYQHGNTSPIVLQRFFHQQKQQQLAKEAEEEAKINHGKKRFTSYIKLQLSGDRSGRSSRHQSPEPPARLNRTLSGDNASPLSIRKNLLESNSSVSPSLSRRYVSPTPPVPPPRRLSESNSVPGSPQHVRARFHYTPEPHRRLFHNNDLS